MHQLLPRSSRWRERHIVQCNAQGSQLAKRSPGGERSGRRGGTPLQRRFAEAPTSIDLGGIRN
jgi:hypothetical protein